MKPKAVDNNIIFVYNNVFFRKFAPMVGFTLDIDKAINALLFVSKKLEGDADFHKTYKILYFADQMHLAEYGRPIVGDTYIKMKYGPVPSYIRDIVSGNITEYQGIFEVYNSKYIRPLFEPNLDFLSETDIELLEKSITENRHLSFRQLTDKSHDLAWHNAIWPLDYEDMYKAVSDDPVMLKYIQVNMLNNNMIL